MFKNWPSFVLLAAGIGAAIATYVSSDRNDKQLKTLERYDSLNNELSQEIISLTSLNTNLSNQINAIVEENRKLAQVNIDLTSKANTLIANVEGLTSATHILTTKLDFKVDKDIAQNALTGKIELINYKSLSDNDNVTFVLGGSNLTNPVSAWNVGASLGLMNNEEPVKFKTKENKVLVSLECYDKNGFYIGDIEENNWRRNPNYTSKFNYDKKGIEIIDNRNEVAFSVDINQIQGQHRCKREHYPAYIAMKLLYYIKLCYEKIMYCIRDFFITI